MTVRRATWSNRDNGAAFSLFRDGLFILSFLFICRRLYHEVTFGGTAYKQADWLINSIHTDVRRGPFGEALIHISDAVGLSPLIALALFKVFLLGILFVAFRGLVRQVEDPRIALLLAVSPAIFTLFWVASPVGALRKELLTFAGLSLAAGAAVQGNRVALVAGVVLLCTGFWAHEALVLFTPLFLWFSWVALPPGKTRIIAPAAVCLCALFALVYALSHRHIPDPGVVCQPLLDRGLSARLCDGAIDWLGRDTDDISETFAKWATPSFVLGFAISYLFAMAPLIYVLSCTDRARLAISLAFAAVLPFLPLYGVAIDWGRWMSFHVFSISLGIAVALGVGKLVLTRPVRTDICLCFIVSALLISPHHVIGAIYGGFLLRTAEFFSRFVVKIGGIVGG